MLRVQLQGAAPNTSSRLGDCRLRVCLPDVLHLLWVGACVLGGRAPPLGARGLHPPVAFRGHRGPHTRRLRMKGPRVVLPEIALSSLCS